jgi:hypothetical protein
MMKTLLLLLSSLVLFAASAHAESIYLKDGKIVRGTITEEDDKTILLETNDTWQKIDKSTIEFIRKDDRQRGEPSGMTEGDTKDLSAAPEKNRAEIGKWETILKIAADVGGRHSFSNVNVVGTDTLRREGSTIGTGITLTAEEIHYVRPAIGIGAGISYQTTRQEPVSGGHFSFIPIYGLVRVRLTPTSDNGYSFATAQLGYNYFIADQEYAGAGNYEMTNGAYAGLGAGYVFGRMQVEVLYTVDQGRLSGNGYDSLNAHYSISADAAYRKISLSLGFIF